MLQKSVWVRMRIKRRGRVRWHLTDMSSLSPGHTLPHKHKWEKRTPSHLVWPSVPVWIDTPLLKDTQQYAPINTHINPLRAAPQPFLYHWQSKPTMWEWWMGYPAPEAHVRDPLPPRPALSGPPSLVHDSSSVSPHHPASLFSPSDLISLLPSWCTHVPSHTDSPFVWTGA